MTSPASKTRSFKVSFAVVAPMVVVAVLVAGWSRAQAAAAAPAALETETSETEAPEHVAAAPTSAVEPAVESASHPFADRFPNLVLRTHEGKNVRFYDDLLKDKIVLINFMYATCKER